MNLKQVIKGEWSCPSILEGIMKKRRAANGTERRNRRKLKQDIEAMYICKWYKQTKGHTENKEIKIN